MILFAGLKARFREFPRISHLDVIEVDGVEVWVVVLHALDDALNVGRVGLGVGVFLEARGLAVVLVGQPEDVGHLLELLVRRVGEELGKLLLVFHLELARVDLGVIVLSALVQRSQG